MKKLAIRAASLLFLVLAQVPIVAAHDHRPPAATLVSSSGRQEGKLVDSLWLKRDGGCVVSFGTGFGFPKGIRATRNDPLEIRLRKDEMPVEWEVTAWSSVDEHGNPEGPGRPIPSVLRRRNLEEFKGWSLQVAPGEVLSPHLYLQVGVYWQDQDDCATQPDVGSQGAVWRFHLKF